MIVTARNSLLRISIYFLLALTICEAVVMVHHKKKLKSFEESEPDCDEEDDDYEPAPRRLKGSRRILGGNATKEGDFPFYQQIVVYHFFKNDHCNGALIHPKLVLTTASCMGDWSDASVQPYIYGLSSREHIKYETDVKDSCKSFLYRKKSNRNQGENVPWRSSDLVVLKFNNELPINAVVNTIEIGTKHPQIGQVMTFIGRGKKGPKSIQAVVTQCSTFATDSTSFCVTVQNKKYDRFCESDVGGPLIGDDNKLYGLLSYTVSCFQSAVMVDLVNIRPHAMQLIQNCSDFALEESRIVRFDE